MQHRIVVRRRRRPWVWAVAAALGLALLAGAGYAAWQLWGADREPWILPGPGAEFRDWREERRHLIRELATARKELVELKGRGAFEKQSCQIDAQACEALRGSMAGLEAEVAELREQVAFYRNVSAPEQEVRAGVRVMRLLLRPGSGPRNWAYELVLVQPTRRNRTVSGRYDLRLTGMTGRQVKTLGLDQLEPAAPAERSFSFRSFEAFSGELDLPAGFLPSRLAVTLRVQDGKGETVEVEESFDWARLAAGPPGSRK